MKNAHRIPDVILGMLLAVSLFLLGMAFSHSLHPNNNASKDNAASTTTKQESLGAASDDRIFGWQAIDIFTGLVFIATVGLGAVTAVGIKNQTSDTRILQRAYLTIEPRGIHLVRDGDAVLGHIGIKNVGKLPAQNVSWRVRMILTADGGLKSFPIQDEEDGRIVLVPNAIARQGSQDRVPLQNITDRFNSGTGWLYVWGIVRYDDGFGKRRYTRFCHRYNCRAQAVGAIAASGARYHAHGNYAD
jgi:hypothetical protein